MKKVFGWPLVALILSVAAPAHATEATLTAVLTPPWVYVWKSRSALDEGQALLNARAGQDLISPFVACQVPSGTRAVTPGGTIGVKHVTVLEGPSRGCRGIVDDRDFKRPK